MQIIKNLHSNDLLVWLALPQTVLYLYIQKQEIISIEGIRIKLPNAKNVEIEYLADL